MIYIVFKIDKKEGIANFKKLIHAVGYIPTCRQLELLKKEVRYDYVPSQNWLRNKFKSYRNAIKECKLTSKYKYKGKRNEKKETTIINGPDS